MLGFNSSVEYWIKRKLSGRGIHSSVLPVLKMLHDDVCDIGEDDMNLTADIKRRVLEYLDEKYSDPLARRLLSVASFLDPRFIADYVPTDVGMSRVNI